MSVLLVLSITLLFIGFLGVIIYDIGEIYASQHVLPPAYRLQPFTLAAAIISVMLLLMFLLYLFI